MNQKERMLAGLPYKGGEDGLAEMFLRCRRLLQAYNASSPDEGKRRRELLVQLLGRCGEHIYIEPPFHCDYGCNIEVGEHFYANFNCVILDVGPVRIGSHVLLGPNVALYTPAHPLHWQSRNSGYECGRQITIGDNVWLGGNVVVNPGIAIGSNVVVGSGSVVTRDIPANSLAAGNPCRVMREITDEDRPYYFRKLAFDVTDYLE